MPDGVSLYMSLQDKFSPGLRSMANNVKSFDKNVEDLERSISDYQKRQNALTADSAKLRTALELSNKQVKEAKDAYRKYGDEVSRGVLERAIREQTEYKERLKDTEAAMKSNRKAMRDLAEESSKSDGLGTIVSSLEKAGLSKLFGDSISQLAGAGLESAFGQPTATAISSILSGIVSGAAMGTAAGGLGLGTLVGAGIGATAGAVNAATAVFTETDDAFKSYVQEAAEGQLSQRDSDIAAGSAIAATREGNLRALGTLMGDKRTAYKFQQSLIEIGRTPPFSYDTAYSLSQGMLGLGLSGDEVLGRISSLSNAAAALDLSESSVSGIVSYLESSQLSGKLESRVLKSLSKLGINAYEALAQEFDLSPDEVAAKLDKLDVERGVQAIYNYMGTHFEGAAESLSKSYSGLQGILSSYEEDMQSAYGEGYNKERSRGLQDQIDWLSGDSGDAQWTANEAVGAWMAHLENEKERYIREAVDAAMESEEYQDAWRAGDAAEMGRIIMAAKVKGQNEYNASEGAQLLLESELGVAEAIRSNTALNDAYWDAGYRMGQQYSKGRAYGMEVEDTYTKSAMNSDHPFAGAAQELGWTIGLWLAGKDSSHAYGLDRVPYDGYRAVLHEGERVLTAREARAADNGGGSVTVTVTGNTFVMRSEDDAGAIAREIAAQVRLKVLGGRC